MKARMLGLIVLVCLTGCKVSTGVFIEKDWVVDDSMAKPDLRTKWEVRMERNFDGWDEVLMTRPDKEHP